MSPPLPSPPDSDTPAPHPAAPPAAMIAEAFDLGHPIESLTPHRYGSTEAWTLSTVAGRFRVTRLWSGPDLAGRPAVERAMEFEHRACHAGLDLPRPIEPRTPAFGCAARVHGFGLFRAYEWVDHRPLEPGDDTAAWLGTTLAALHQVEPLDETPEPEGCGLFPATRWHGWLSEGEAQGRVWAPALRERLPEILDVSQWVAAAFVEADGPVVTHREIEPWNVLVTPRGPVLVGWDAAGPDSAPLEAAQAILAFAAFQRPEPDGAAVKHALAAYVADGGHPLPSGRALTARRMGRGLQRLAERLELTLRATDEHAADLLHAGTKAREQLEELPGAVETLTRWSTLFGT